MKKLFAAFLVMVTIGTQQVLPVQAAGSLSGMVWEDLNFDGIRQADERVLSGYTVTLQGAHDGQSVQTDANGNYHFAGLTPGEYTLSTFAVVQTFPTQRFNQDIRETVTVPEGALSGINLGISNSVPRVHGTVWRNANEVQLSQVLAYVGDTLCGSRPANLLYPPHTPLNFFDLTFAPPGLIPGCDDGATVRFLINGEEAPLTMPYPATLAPAASGAPQSHAVEIVYGPAFARYHFERPGRDSDGAYHMASGELRAMIDGVDCGIRLSAQSEYVSVLPASLRAGCGVEGSIVQFFFGELKAEPPVIWTPGMHEITLTLPAAPEITLGEPHTEEVPAPELTGEPVTQFRPPTVGDAGLR